MRQTHVALMLCCGGGGVELDRSGLAGTEDLDGGWGEPDMRTVRGPRRAAFGMSVTLGEDFKKPAFCLLVTCVC